MLRSLKTSVVVGLSLVALMTAIPQAAFGAKGHDKLDEMAIDRWPKLRETERYQLKIAEKYYREDRNYAVAAGEYEKFLTLYESSEGASYAQLMWATCQVHLKKLNTAIKDGYQSVIDYWPDSQDAVAAAYLIGETYKAMGEIPLAKQAYLKVIDKHNGETVATLARLDLADIARIEQDRSRQMALLKELVTSAERTGTARERINQASYTLATMYFEDGQFPDGVAMLETTFKEPQTCSRYVWQYLNGPLGTLFANAETKQKAETMAQAAITYFTKLQPADTKEDAAKQQYKDQAYRIAGVESRVGKKDEAGKVYEDLVKKFGDDDVLVQYGAYLNGEGKREEARRAFGRMKDQINSLIQMAYSYRDERNYEKAIPLFQELITRDTKNTTANNGGWAYQLGYTYQLAGKYKEAIGTYQQSEYFPHNLDQIAQCYRSMKQYKEAIGVYTQIVAGYEPQAPEAMLNIARTYEADGKPENAIKTLQTVCKKYPKSGQASTAHQHLNNVYKITVTMGGAKEE